MIACDPTQESRTIISQLIFTSKNQGKAMMSPDEQTKSSSAVLHDTLLSSIDEVVSKSLKSYLADCGDKTLTHLYYTVIEQVDASIVGALMEHYDQNQTKVSKVLGLSRGKVIRLVKENHLITKK